MPKIRFHGLRHTNATLILKHNIPAKVASERLGHSGIGITLDLYSHVMKEMQEDAANKIDKAIFKDKGITPIKINALSSPVEMKQDNIGNKIKC